MMAAENYSVTWLATIAALMLHGVDRPNLRNWAEACKALAALMPDTPTALSRISGLAIDNGRQLVTAADTGSDLLLFVLRGDYRNWPAPAQRALTAAIRARAGYIQPRPARRTAPRRRAQADPPPVQASLF